MQKVMLRCSVLIYNYMWC